MKCSFHPLLLQKRTQLLHNSYGFSSLQTLFKGGLYLFEYHHDMLGGVVAGEF